MKNLTLLIITLSFISSYGQDTLYTGSFTAKVKEAKDSNAYPAAKSISQSLNQTVSTDSLYVIDGIPQSANEFQNIKHKDIISITVLEDANALAMINCRNPNRTVIIVKTINSLTKREQKRRERELKKLKT